jgi:integrase/recombinase XerD
MTDLQILAERYLHHRVDFNRLSALRRRTLHFYLRDFVRWLERSAGITQVQPVAVGVLAEWHRQASVQLSKRTGMPLLPGSIYAYVTAVRGFCFWLIKEGHLPSAMAETLPWTPMPAIRTQVALRHEEVREWLESFPMKTPCDFCFRALIELLYSTGARALEALQLDLDSIDLEKAQVRVMGKGSKERILPIGRTALHHLEVYLAGVRPMLLRRKDETALWLNRGGNRLGYGCFREMFNNCDGWAGRRVTAQVLRRSCATEMLRSGASLWAVKELLGHDDLESLEHYLLLDLADLKETHTRCHPRDLPPGTSPPEPDDSFANHETTQKRWWRRQRC